MTAICGPSGPLAIYSSDPVGHRDALNGIVKVRCPPAVLSLTSPIGLDAGLQPPGTFTGLRLCPDRSGPAAGLPPVTGTKLPGSCRSFACSPLSVPRQASDDRDVRVRLGRRFLRGNVWPVRSPSVRRKLCTGNSSAASAPLFSPWLSYSRQRVTRPAACMQAPCTLPVGRAIRTDATPNPAQAAERRKNGRGQ